MTSPNNHSGLDQIAEEYVKLVLALGLHDADYVDAYYGPEAWKTEVSSGHRSLADIRNAAQILVTELHSFHVQVPDDLLKLRHQYLAGQLQSLIARAEILEGTRMTFDQESQALYDAVAPSYPETHFARIRQQLEQLIPGAGSLPDRYQQFKNSFIISKDRLDDVFGAAINESRRRTMEYIPLPTGEDFTVEYVTNKSWSGYNWYKGNSHSVIQVNTDLPISIDRAIDLAAHEGYPGHHVYNSLLEHHLVRRQRWMEFTVYALFSPQSLIAEGTANFGIEVAFPDTERIEFEQRVLFPTAGLDPAEVAHYYAVHQITQKLAYAGNEAARNYLNGTVSREEAARWLVEYALMSPERALQRTRFFDQYRSYVINYNLGQDLVRSYIEARGGIAANPARLWQEFHLLISSPRLPSGLV